MQRHGTESPLALPAVDVIDRSARPSADSTAVRMPVRPLAMKDRLLDVVDAASGMRLHLSTSRQNAACRVVGV